MYTIDEYLIYLIHFTIHTFTHDVLIFQPRQGSSHFGSGDSGGNINSEDTDDWNRSLEQKTQGTADGVENYGFLI